MCCCAIMEAAPSRKRRSRHADTPRTSFHHQPPTHAHTFHPHLPPSNTATTYDAADSSQCQRVSGSAHGIGASRAGRGRRRRTPTGSRAFQVRRQHTRNSFTAHPSVIITPQLTASPPLRPSSYCHTKTQTPTPPQRCGRAAPARQPIASAACRRRLASRATRSCARSARRCSSRTSPRSRGTLSSGSRSSLPSE